MSAYQVCEGGQKTGDRKSEFVICRELWFWVPRQHAFGCPELAVGRKGVNIMCRHCLTGNSDLSGERSKDL